MYTLKIFVLMGDDVQFKCDFNFYFSTEISFLYTFLKIKMQTFSLYLLFFFYYIFREIID